MKNECKMGMRLPEELRAILEAEAAKRGLGISVLVRMLLLEHFEQELKQNRTKKAG